ncbi:MAG: hypothetical protein ACTSXV_01275 [Alphaproteobacteria bacterium]
MNIFSANHWKLLFLNAYRAPNLLWISLGGVSISWIIGILYFRKKFKVSKMKNSTTVYSVGNEEGKRPISQGKSKYIPEKGHYNREVKEHLFTPHSI